MCINLGTLNAMDKVCNGSWFKSVLASNIEIKKTLNRLRSFRRESAEWLRTGGERDGWEVSRTRTELGNWGINRIYSLGCATNCWTREESRCGLVGSRINSSENKCLRASWKLPTLMRPERALTEGGITLHPSKRAGNTHCLPSSLTHIRKKKKKKRET